MKKLNLGCGKNIIKGYVNLDYIKQKGINKVHDLEEFPYPFDNNTFEEIYASHIIEHLPNTILVMKELHRVSKPNARIIIRVPHFSAWANYGDITHKKMFSHLSMDYFTNNDFFQDREERGMFKIIKKRLNYFPIHMKIAFLNPLFYPLLNWFPKIYERFFHGIFPCAEIYWELKVIKGEQK